MPMLFARSAGRQGTVESQYTPGHVHTKQQYTCCLSACNTAMPAVCCQNLGFHGHRCAQCPKAIWLPIVKPAAGRFRCLVDMLLLLLLLLGPQAKALGDVLVVGLIPDREVLRCKGPPVLDEQERLLLVDAVKWVDEIITGGAPNFVSCWGTTAETAPTPTCTSGCCKQERTAFLSAVHVHQQNCSADCHNHVLL